MSLTVTIPGRPPNVGNARMSWRAKAVLAKSRKALVGLLTSSARAEAHLQPAKGKRKATATVSLAGAFFDPDNVVAALKFDLDGLVAGGALEDDTADLLVLMPVRQRRVQTRPQQKVVWEVTDG